VRVSASHWFGLRQVVTVTGTKAYPKCILSACAPRLGDRALKEPGQAQKEPVRLIRPAVEEWGEEPDPFANSIANDGPE